jgi:hypothetical protein
LLIILKISNLKSIMATFVQPILNSKLGGFQNRSRYST